MYALSWEDRKCGNCTAALSVGAALRRPRRRTWNNSPRDAKKHGKKKQKKNLVAGDCKRRFAREKKTDQ
jgi:hypothetical protein